MLTRISLIVAIIAGLGVAVVNFTKIKDTVTTLRTDLASEKSAKEMAQGEAATAKKNEGIAKKELESTKTELTETQTARDQAVATAETQTKRAARLSEDLAKTQQEKSDAQAELAAWSALGVTASQVKPMMADLKATKDENATLTEANKDYAFKVTTLTNRLAKYEDPENYRVQLKASAHGKVVVADPKWDFVVLDFGANQGALEDGVLLVNRNGRLVAKVQIRSVQPDRCIANVLPNWKLGDVMEGDSVIP